MLRLRRLARSRGLATWTKDAIPAETISTLHELGVAAGEAYGDLKSLGSRDARARRRTLSSSSSRRRRGRTAPEKRTLWRARRPVRARTGGGAPRGRGRGGGSRRRCGCDVAIRDVPRNPQAATGAWTWTTYAERATNAKALGNALASCERRAEICLSGESRRRRGRDDDAGFRGDGRADIIPRRRALDIIPRRHDEDEPRRRVETFHLEVPSPQVRRRARRPRRGHLAEPRRVRQHDVRRIRLRRRARAHVRRDRAEIVIMRTSLQEDAAAAAEISRRGARLGREIEVVAPAGTSSRSRRSGSTSSTTRRPRCCSFRRRSCCPPRARRPRSTPSRSARPNCCVKMRGLRCGTSATPRGRDVDPSEGDPRPTVERKSPLDGMGPRPLRGADRGGATWIFRGRSNADEDPTIERDGLAR